MKKTSRRTIQPDSPAAIRQLKREVQGAFRDRAWSRLERALHSVTRLGEERGQRELCLAAQALCELVEIMRGDQLPGLEDRLEELLTRLDSRLSHVQWVERSRDLV